MSNNDIELSSDALRLLNTMKSGVEVIFRATTGKATYYSSAMGERDCTRALEELHKHKLVKPGQIDKRSGWVWYVPNQSN